ncbi:MAG: PEP-CTERM sorting domain-containing protein [Acetobacteraceae bacterium]
MATGLVPGSVAAVNCLGIGASANCSFVAGAGTDFGSVTFANLDAALTAKIQTETTIPEPATLLVVGVSVMCIGVVRRKRA